jgi:hypothetical protein
MLNQTAFSRFSTKRQNHRDFYPDSPPFNVKIAHRIYDGVLFYLANPRIRLRESDRVVFRPGAEAFLSNHGFTDPEIERMENEILFFAENYSTKYEIVRDAPAILLDELRRRNLCEWISEKRIVRLPNSMMNALICERLQKEFSRNVLLSCAGFIERVDTGEKGERLAAVRIDIDEKLIRKGFMMPVFRSGLIAALKVFRHPKDERPFNLKSRSGGLKW